jgi:hypothetical protein
LTRKVWKLLQSDYAGDFALSAAHPVGDPVSGEDPLCFHPHLNLVWLQKRPGNGFIDVDRLRADFARILGTAGPVDLWHRYSYKVEEIQHILSYVCRPFPGLSEWTGPVRWLGSYPRKTKEERDADEDQAGRCPVCHQHRIYIGRSDQAEFLEYVARMSHEKLLQDLAKYERPGPVNKSGQNYP